MFLLDRPLPTTMLPRALRVARDVGDVLLPRTCATCQTPAADGPQCAACAAQLRLIARRPRCGACGKPVLAWAEACWSCHGRGHRPAGAVEVVGVHEGPLADLVRHNKFHGRWWCGEHLADLLWERPAVRRMLLEADVICPVPLHRRREWGRGHNQAATIGRRLAGLAGVPLAWPVTRRRATAPQASLGDVRHRAANLRGAFRVVDPLAVHGRRAVLIDDVVTTGMTLRAFARQVRRCRPITIGSLAAAVARPRGWDSMRPAIDASLTQG